MFKDCAWRTTAGGEQGDGFTAGDARPRPVAAGHRRAGLGIAQGALDYALDYATSGETFGKPIAQHQVIQSMLADMAVRVARRRAALLYECGDAR